MTLLDIAGIIEFTFWVYGKLGIQDVLRNCLKNLKFFVVSSYNHINFSGTIFISPSILASTPAKVYNNSMDLLKKLTYQSWHRGTRENDLLLGSFANAILPTLSMVDLNAYQKMLTHEDADLFAWITGQRSIPDNEPMVRRIREFHQCR
jgi:antitoxin CptB